MRILLLLCLLACLSAQSLAQKPTVPGNVAALKDGVAYAPANAPQILKEAIWAVNTLRDKPYRWGGGHGTFFDKGYDCSGTISFFLHHAAALENPTPSSALCSYGDAGPGRWVTIWSRRGHTFAMVAGLRLDTTDMQGGREGPRWHLKARPTGAFVARHPRGL